MWRKEEDSYGREEEVRDVRVPEGLGKREGKRGGWYRCGETR